MRPSRLTAEGRPRKKRRVSVYACLTEHEWQKLWHIQDGKCALKRCSRPLRNRYNPGETEDGAIASLDHSHSREKELLAQGYDARDALRGSARGLLCYNCNRNVLHALRDDPEMGYSAGDYLSDPPAASMELLREVRPKARRAA